VRDLIAIALGFKAPPWVQTRTIVGTVSVEDGKYVYSGQFTAQAEFIPKVITNDNLPPKVCSTYFCPSVASLINPRPRM
jgi:hypothetical protein